MFHGLKFLLPCLALASAGAFAQVTGGVVVAPGHEPVPISSSLEMWVGQVKVLKDMATVERDGQQLPVRLGMRLRQHDVLTTAATGSVGIVFNDNSTLSIGADTQIVIERFAFDTTTHAGYFDTHVRRGTVAVQPGHIARNAPEAMRVITPAAELRSRAAQYLVNVKGD
jgi:hypothetical protein